MMFAPFMEDSLKKASEYEELKKRGDHEGMERYNRACITEGMSYGKAGLRLLHGDVGGALLEAKQGIEARVEQQRIVEGEK